MPGFLEIKLYDMKAVRDAVVRAEQALDDLSPIMAEVSEILYDVTMENFEKGGMPTWHALAPATIRQRSKEGYWPGKILQRTGVLKAAIHPFATQNTAMVSVAVPYAEILHKGGTIQRSGYSGEARLRETAGGKLLRQGKTGRGKNLAVFAKDSHKRARTVAFEVEDYTITIPARPYLPVTVAGELQPEATNQILAAFNTYLQKAWGG